jgi:exodeoxyribonuclease VII small subunit
MSSKRASEKRETIESRLLRLDKIVDRLGTGDLALAASSKLFEEGLSLVNDCRLELKQVRKRVERLNLVTGKLEPLDQGEDD